MNSIRNYLWRVFNSIQQSALIPTGIRMLLLKAAGCTIENSARIASDVYIGSPLLTMQRNSFVNIGAFLDGSDRIDIGEGVRIGPHVRILTGTHTYANNEMRLGPGSVDRNRPVIIERGCWLGIGSMVLPGVTVARGCVIGAGAIVAKSTLPNGLYVGSPARRVKDLPV